MYFFVLVVHNFSSEEILAKKNTQKQEVIVNFFQRLEDVFWDLLELLDYLFFG